MRSPFAVLVFLAAGCISIIPAPPSPEAARIQLQLQSPTAEAARDRVMGAMLAEGLTVASASEGVLTTQPIEIAPNLWAIYRANILPDTAGFEVVLTGVVRNSQGATIASYMLGGAAVEAPEYPLHRAMTDEPLAGAWQRLVRVADRLWR